MAYPRLLAFFGKTSVHQPPKSHPEVEVNLARTRKEHKSLLQGTSVTRSGDRREPGRDFGG